MEGKILTEKQSCRRQFIKERAAIDPVKKILIDAQIWKKVVSLNEFKAAENIFIYAASAEEISTKEIAQSALLKKKRLFYPRVLAEGHMDFLEVKNPEKDLQEGYRGIYEPAPECRIAQRTPDIIIVPGVAFDRDFYRMGYGKGFYDRYFDLVKGGFKKVALCPACMLKDKIPSEPHDEQMDIIITEDEIWTRENYSLNI